MRARRYNFSGTTALRFEADWSGLIALDKAECLVEVEVRAPARCRGALHSCGAAKRARCALGPCVLLSRRGGPSTSTLAILVPPTPTPR